MHGDARSAAEHIADLYVIATPMAGLAQSLSALAGSPVPVIWLCKGFDENGRLAHEIAAQYATKSVANGGYGVLSGPSFAQEVARGQPTALVGASESAQLRAQMVAAFHSERLRVYENSDVIGVEVGGAVKNVLAIATGLCDGLALGLNARAALITRGLAEMTRLGVALGAQAETFMGLSGLGDLVLTATGDLSRNRKVGLLLAQGQNLQQATASLGHVAEGARCAAAVLSRAQSLGVDMPITQGVVALLAGRIDANQAVQLLMAREPGKEV
jgi:glycerol-3-phosphate dehydrogenase (NAD(P)+)